MARKLKLFGKSLTSFESTVKSYVEDLGREYDLGAMLVDHFVATANKGEMLANTPSAREAMRRKLKAERKMKEDRLRQPGIGRLLLTDDYNEQFLMKKDDPIEWKKYQHLDGYMGIELFLQELYINQKVRLWRQAHQSEAALITFYDHVDQFQRMYLGGFFSTEFNLSYPIDEAWRLFLMCTPRGMEYMENLKTWMQSFEEEIRHYSALDGIDKATYALARQQETIDKRRQRIEEAIKAAAAGDDSELPSTS